MKGNFMQLKRFLESQYPELHNGNIQGMVHPPTFTGELIGNVVSMIWVVGIGLLIGGDFLFQTLKIPLPDWYLYMKENKLSCFVGLFLLNNVGAAMAQTGAFEVYINDTLIFSKLATGRMPNGNDITTALEKFGL